MTFVLSYTNQTNTGGFYRWIQDSGYSPAINMYPPASFLKHWRLPHIGSSSMHQISCSQLVKAEWSSWIHHWPSATLHPHSPAQDPSMALPVSLSKFLSLSLLSIKSSYLSLSFKPCPRLSIKYHTQHSVLLCSCMGVIQSKLHQHSNQSRNLSCCLSTPEERLTCEPSPRCHSLKLLQECKGLQAQSSSWGQFIVFSEKYPSLMQGLEII